MATSWKGSEVLNGSAILGIPIYCGLHVKSEVLRVMEKRFQPFRQSRFGRQSRAAPGVSLS